MMWENRKERKQLLPFALGNISTTNKQVLCIKKSIPTLFLPRWMCDIQLPGWMCATNYSIFEQLHDNQQNEVMFMKAKKVGTIIKASAI